METLTKTMQRCFGSSTFLLTICLSLFHHCNLMCMMYLEDTFHLKQCYLRGVRPDLTTIVKMALVRWKLFIVPSSGSEKFKWSHESALAVVNQLCENGSIQYTALKDSVGEKLVDKMIKEHILDVNCYHLQLTTWRISPYIPY